MRIKIHPAQEYLKSILNYNQDSGIFVWKYRTDCSNYWNKNYVGTVAGSIGSRGYISIQIGTSKTGTNNNFRAHRLAWIYIYGNASVDIMEIDHIDGNKQNNRIANLRLCTRSQNLHNTNGWVNKKLDLPKGVFKNGKNPDKGYGARIGYNGKNIWLGTYDTIPEAKYWYDYAAQYYQKEFARGG